MLVSFVTKTTQQKFGLQVYQALRRTFPQTFFVGGMIRNLLLSQPVADIDLATEGTPEQVEQILRHNQINTDSSNAKFGVITAKLGEAKVEIATFRKDLAAVSRYPKVRFVKTPKADSARRDFTINALYYDYQQRKVYDYHRGLLDLKNRRLRFIGRPDKRILEDPLRIVRALRFQFQYNFILERQTKASIQKYFYLLKKLSKTKVAAEISKLPNKSQRVRLQKIINSLHLTHN